VDPSVVTAPPPGRAPPIALVLGVAYPLAAHVATVTGLAPWRTASIAVLLALVLIAPLRRGRAWAWLLLAGAVAALWRLGDSSLATLPLFAPPVLIAGGVAWLFGRSLLAGEVPLIERFAQAMEGADLDAERQAYARRLTAVWAGFTATLAIVNLALALLAEPHGLLAAAGLHPPVSVPLEAWSLFANVLNYVLLGGLFAGEFAWRRHRFPGQAHGRFVDFVRGLGRLGPAMLRGRPGTSR